MASSFKINHSDYVFWLDTWFDSSKFWGKPGRYKCLITRDKIDIKSIENAPDKELSIEISSIQSCKVAYGSREPNRYVDISLGDKKFTIRPVNPFEPKTILFVNHHEVSAMVGVINAFRSNNETTIDPNPYLRQLSTKQVLKKFRTINVEWDKHTSPWEYYELYGDKFIWLKLISFIIVLVPVIMALIFLIVYVLDTMNIT